MRRAPSWAVTIFGGVSIGAGRLFGLIELYVIGTGLILSVVAAVLQMRTRNLRLALRRDVEPSHPMAGTEVQVVLTLESLRRTPTCELVDLVDETGRVGLTLTPLAKHRIARVRYSVPTQRRGILTLGPAIVEMSDPFGLLSRRRQIGTTTEVIVHPHWSAIDLPDPQHCEGALLDLIRRLIDQMAVNLEFRSLREYVSGDDLRRINWKASARRDLLTLNEFESRAPIVVHVLLDSDDSAFTLSGFERAVSVVASFVGSAISDQKEFEPRVHLSLPPAFDSIIDSSTRLDAMRCLAQVTGESATFTPAILNDPGEFRINVIVCGNRNRQWLESTDRSMGTGHVTVVIYCETQFSQDFGHDHWLALSCSDFQAFSTSWETLSRRKANG